MKGHIMLTLMALCIYEKMVKMFMLTGFLKMLMFGSGIRIIHLWDGSIRKRQVKMEKICTCKMNWLQGYIILIMEIKYMV